MSLRWIMQSTTKCTNSMLGNRLPSIVTICCLLAAAVASVIQEVPDTFSAESQLRAMIGIQAFVMHEHALSFQSDS